MPSFAEMTTGLAIFAGGVAIGALGWHWLTFRWIRAIEDHWKGENEDLRERLRLVRAAAPIEHAKTASVSSAAAGTAEPVEPDELTRIKGIGPKIAGLLNARGITTYSQIASWSDAEVDRIQKELKFPGRARRDKWVERARQEHIRKYGENGDGLQEARTVELQDAGDKLADDINVQKLSV